MSGTIDDARLIDKLKAENDRLKIELETLTCLKCGTNGDQVTALRELVREARFWIDHELEHGSLLAKDWTKKAKQLLGETK